MRGFSGEGLPGILRTRDVDAYIEADSGGSNIRNPLLEVVGSGESTEGVEGPIARGYIAE